MVDAPDLRLVESAGTTPGGDVLVFVEGGSVVILLRGDIDLTCTDDLEEAGRAAIDARRPIMVDVRHVDLIDSVGLSFLIRLAASVRTGGGTLTLCGPSPMVDDLLGITGSRTLFRWMDGGPGPDGRPTP